MTGKELFSRFEAVAADPRGQLDGYLAQGKKVVLCAPLYTPEELVDAMGAVPMAIWGADRQLKDAKRYFPAFICSIVQSCVELGMNGVYDGASAVLIPHLCDSLKVMGENWKYAVPSIPYIPVTLPQNRKPDYALDYTLASYRRIIADLERILGVAFEEEKLRESLRVYNEHNALMGRFRLCCVRHGEISAVERAAVYKSAQFMPKAEHSALLRQLLDALETESGQGGKLPIVITGILADAPSLLRALDENGLQIVADDVAAETRQYKTDAPTEGEPLRALAEKFRRRDNCSLLYDPKKGRVEALRRLAEESGAKGVLLLLTKFCDPEEFDAPALRRACEEAGLVFAEIEVDRQTEDHGQAATAIETFREMLRER